MSDQKLIAEIYRTINLIGMRKTIDALRNASGSHFSNEYAKYVVSEVNKYLKITYDEVAVINSRSDKRKVAIGFYGYFLYDFFEFKSWQQVSSSIPLKITGRVYFNYYLIIKKAKIDNPRSDIDRMIAENKKKLEHIFSEFKKENKQL